MNSSQPLTRPTSQVEGSERQQGLVPLMGENSLNFQPQPTDLFISPFPKCGITWLQQIVHSLRTEGDPDFSDISQDMPWLETAHMLGVDPHKPQRGSFRAFKSHLDWHSIPKGGRYIVSFRDPKAALVSFYHFFEGRWWEAGTISLEEFVRSELAGLLYLTNRGPGSYWSHLASWWEQRHNQNVRLLCYETMTGDLPGLMQDIASFIGLELDERALELVVRQTSLNFMLAHKMKFDELLMREYFEEIGFLQAAGAAAKLRNSHLEGHPAELPPAVSAELDAIWRDEIEARFGLSSYQALREALV